MDRLNRFTLEIEILPNLFTSEGQDGREKPDKSVGDSKECCLRRPPIERVGSQDIKTVLYDIEVEIRQINDAKIVKGVVNDVKFKVPVGFPHPARHATHAPQCPAVQLGQIFVIHRLAVVEIKQVAQKKTMGIADLSISFPQP